MKVCPTCKLTLDLSKFSKNKNTKDGYYCYCKECEKIRKRKYQKKKPKKDRGKIPPDFKVCPYCSIEKPNTDFSKNRSRWDKLEYCCRECSKKRNKIYVEKVKNIPETKQCGKCEETKSREESNLVNKYKDGLDNYCKNCRRETKKEFYQRTKNTPHYKNYRKKYGEKYRERRNKRLKTYIKNKRNEDKVYYLSTLIKPLIRHAFKNKRIKKNTKTKTILGCTYDEFEIYLNKNKYGFKVGDKNLDLDHIIPISSAKTEREVIQLNHYTNFQLLPSYYNRHIKRNNPFDVEDFENWLKSNK